jgi:hypothetical protein
LTEVKELKYWAASNKTTCGIFHVGKRLSLTAGSCERISFAASTPAAIFASVTGHAPLRMPVLCNSRWLIFLKFDLGQLRLE